jgi:hypothetical protein
MPLRNDFRLVALVQYLDSILMIRFFGSHEEYDGIDAETVVMKTTLIVIQNEADHADAKAD